MARRRTALVAIAAVAAIGAAGAVGASPGSTSHPDAHATHQANEHGSRALRPADRIAALRAAAAYQDVAIAEAAGYASTLDTLGCFEDPQGGMGLHYVNGGLLDDELDVRTPEALVYELRADGSIAGLVAHEYIVPVEAWSSNRPPRVAGIPLHRHPSLPLWVLHTWIWRDNAWGELADWNPAVRPCPDGVPVFGQDAGSP
jgi:hypothetical protein